jgi:hypothetical protein
MMSRVKTGNILTLVVSTLFSLVAVELLLRVVTGVPIFSWRDWRVVVAESKKTGVSYDPLLGWVQTPGITSKSFNTIEHGLRRNSSAGDEKAVEGAILAVGDSFAAGSEVDDQYSWPAYLERALGTRVLNAAIGGYGIDQAVLRAEALLPVLKPKVVLVGFLAPDDILRTGYERYGRPRPYFIKSGDGFKLMNNPVPTDRDQLQQSSAFMRLMSHSLGLHRTFQAVAADWWMSELGHTYKRVRNDPAAVSCHVLGRLRAKLEPAGVRGVIVVQHGGWIFSRNEERAYQTDQVIRCAREQGYEVVDEYDSINRIARRSIDELKQLYVMHGGGKTYGHMSEKGNELVASLIAEHLRKPATNWQASQSSAKAPDRPKGDGRNRLADVAPSKFGLANSRIATVSGSGPVKGEPVLRLSATSETSEHYASIAWKGENPGRYVFSVHVRRKSNQALRLQLLDSGGNGLISDFELDSSVTNLIKAGRVADTGFTASDLGDDWVRLALTASLPGSGGTVILQLTKPEGVTNFAGGSTELLLQAPMLEQGAVPSVFCRPGQCPAPAGQ